MAQNTENSEIKYEYFENGTVTQESNPSTYKDKLDVGIYEFISTPKGSYLKKANEFTLPKKLYGDVSMSDRYLKMFNSRDKNLGVLLYGKKGGGKSVLAKKMCIDSNLPVIMINSAYHGSTISSFFSKVEQDCILLFDEFEKVYSDYESQNSLLTIMDGVLEGGKKMFILTINEEEDVSDYIINRPGRVWYAKEYSMLSSEVISEIIDDKLIDSSQKEDLMDALEILGQVTMDILVSLIEDMNIFNCSAIESIDHMNIFPDKCRYEVTLTINDKVDFSLNARINYHPLALYLTSDEEFEFSRKITDRTLEIAGWDKKETNSINFFYDYVENNIKTTDYLKNSVTSVMNTLYCDIEYNLVENLTKVKRGLYQATVKDNPEMKLLFTRIN